MGLGDINIRYNMPNCEKRIKVLEQEVHNIIYNSTTGTSGTSGTNGTTGSSGTSAVGSSGTSGTSGNDGVIGTSGTSGESGTSGINGVNGTSGLSGTSGSSGTSSITTDTNFANTDLIFTGNRTHEMGFESLLLNGAFTSNGQNSFSFNTASFPEFKITGEYGDGQPATIILDDTLEGNPFRIERVSTATLLRSAGGTTLSDIRMGSGALTLTVSTDNGLTIKRIAESSSLNSGIEITDSKDLIGLHYAADYNVNGIIAFGNRWIPDVGYVNSLISTGTSGTSGTSGLSGTSGIDGTSGTAGTSGINGTSGVNGANGTSGVNGTSGTGGTSGTSGVGTVTSFTFTDGNGFDGTVINPTTTPTLSLTTTVSTNSLMFSNSGAITGSANLTWNGNQLDITGSSAPGFRIYNPTVGSNGFYFYNGAGTAGNFGIFDITAGLDRLVLSSTGQLKLGANAASSPATIIGPLGDAVFNENGANADFRIEGDTDQNLFFVDASADKVGIGTASPTYKLQVSDNAFFGSAGNATRVRFGNTFNMQSYAGAATAGGMSGGIYYDGADWRTEYGFAGGLYWVGSGGELGFYTTAAGSAGAVVSVSRKMAIENTGNVRIGTSLSAPTEKLVVEGNIIATAPTYSTGGFNSLVLNTTSGRFETTTLSSISRTISTISSSATAGATVNTDYVYLITGTTTLTLPTAVGNNNRYSAKNIGSGTVTVDTTSSQTIDGGLSISLTGTPSFDSVDLISDGSNWWII